MFMNFTLSDVIQLFSVLVALLLGLISIIISIKTMRQNSKMIEESTRPILIIYSEYADNDNLNLVVKNIGKSCATIKDFRCNYDLLNSGSYAFEGGDYLLDYITLTLPPDEGRKCTLVRKSINAPVEFDIKYTSSTNTYTDHVSINLKAGMSTPLYPI
ncbi:MULTISPECIES: hypothetical protein [unclassified Lacrimispora]|uniref:hypothetical protein n=1 Tax=unclassified Lacrimispora TaxID=2719232 RepID=UPI00377047FD